MTLVSYNCQDIEVHQVVLSETKLRMPDDQPALESLALSVLSYWSNNITTYQRYELMSRNFSQEEIFEAQKLLLDVPPPKRKDGKGVTKCYLQAQDIVNYVEVLIKDQKMPKVVCSSQDLLKACRMISSLNISDERGVSARLENLEEGMKKLQTIEAEVLKLARATARNSVQPEAGKDKEVPLPKSKLKYAEVVSEPLQLNEQVKPSKKATKEDAALGMTEKEKSPWIEVKKKGRKTASGARTADFSSIGFQVKAGPEDFYIGNTAKETSKEQVENVLKLSAAALEKKNFHVLEVELLPCPDPNPRTQCWKVSVPHEFKELMSMDTMYPPGWKHRKFHGARRAREPKNQTESPVSGGPAQQLQEEQAKLRDEQDKLVKKVAEFEERQKSASRLEAASLSSLVQQ